MSPSMLALALMTHPPVTIEVGPGQDPGQAQRLRGDLIVRLLEAGIPIAAEARYRVIISRDEDGLMIEVDSDAGIEQRTVEAGPEAAVRLEVIHRTLEMVRRLPPTDDAGPLPLPVSIEVRDADGLPLPASLMLVDALIERGLSVVPVGRPAAWRLCMLVDGSRWAHMRVDGADTCETAYLLLERADAVPEAELLVALERLSFETETTQDEETVDPIAEPLTLGDRSPQLPAETRRPGPIPFVGVSPGVAFRLDVPDPVVGLRGGLTGAKGFGGAVQIGFLPSRAPGLSLLDTTVEAGPAVRRRLRGRFVLGAGLFAGVLMHRFRFEDRAARTHFDFSVDAPLWLTWRVAGPLHLGFELGAGLSHRPRRHSIDGEVAWRRGALRLHAGVTLELAWGSSS